MKIDERQEEILLTKAALGVKAKHRISSAPIYPLRWLQNTEFWMKDSDKLNRTKLLAALGENPDVLRTINGIGKVSERQILRALFATIGDK
jgi:hypothetical protein